MNTMQSALPPSEAAPPSDIAELIEAMLGDGPIEPAFVARMLDPARLAEREAATRALREQDWANLGRYEGSNGAVAASGARPDLIFMGDSITEIWAAADPDVFGPGRLCRGISGQTSPQMLVRFQADVMRLQPRAVHLLAGTNDIAGNTGPTTPHRYLCAMEAMVALAQGQGIAVLLGLIPPARQMPWNRELVRAPWIAELNAHLRLFADAKKCVVVDYHTALADANGELPAHFSHDGVHPNRRGYVAMRPVLEAAVNTMQGLRSTM